MFLHIYREFFYHVHLMTDKISNKDLINYLIIKKNFIANNYHGNISQQKVINSTERMIKHMQKYPDYYLYDHPETFDPFYELISENPPSLWEKTLYNRVKEPEFTYTEGEFSIS